MGEGKKNTTREEKMKEEKEGKRGMNKRGVKRQRKEGMTEKERGRYVREYLMMVPMEKTMEKRWREYVQKWNVCKICLEPMAEDVVQYFMMCEYCESMVQDVYNM